MISVIIPVYNVKDFLCECVDSIINQSYTDLEIILVDDGSTDGCSEICDSYAEKDNRIKVIHQKNQGLSAARNTGLEHMRGDYLTFVDSDDYLMPSAVERMYTLAKSYEADMVACPFFQLMDDGSFIPFATHARINGTEVFEGADKMASYIRLNKQTNAVWGKLYAKELFQELRFPVGKIVEDVFVTYQVIHNSKRLVIDKDLQYVYRIRSGSIMTSPSSIKKYDVLEGRSLEANFISEYYPELARFAISRLCNEAVLLVFRTATDNFSYPEGDKYLRSILRKNLKVYLKSKHVRKRKIVAVLTVCNIKLARNFIRLFRKTRDI